MLRPTTVHIIWKHHAVPLDSCAPWFDGVPNRFSKLKTTYYLSDFHNERCHWVKMLSLTGQSLGFLSPTRRLFLSQKEARAADEQVRHVDQGCFFFYLGTLSLAQVGSKPRAHCAFVDKSHPHVYLFHKQQKTAKPIITRQERSQVQ